MRPASWRHILALILPPALLAAYLLWLVAPILHLAY